MLAFPFSVTYLVGLYIALSALAPFFHAIDRSIIILTSLATVVVEYGTL